MPAGGRGYTRVPSLISLWSTAPFLLNNTVGPFDPSPSVPARLGSFRTSIEQMLWPERRQVDSELGARAGGLIDRTTRRTYLFVPRSFLNPIGPILTDEDKGLLRQLLDEQGNIQIGPIPQGHRRSTCSPASSRSPRATIWAPSARTTARSWSRWSSSRRRCSASRGGR